MIEGLALHLWSRTLIVPLPGWEWGGVLLF